jgi:hypothetical protein
MKKLIFATIITVISSLPLLADDEVSHPFQNSVPSSGVNRVVVEIPVAELQIVTAHSGDIGVSGTARREYDSDSKSHDQQIADESSVTVRMRGRTAYVEPSYRGSAGSWRNRRGTKFNVKITLPDNLPIDVDQDVGEISINGATGDLNLGVDVGEVRLQMPKKSVRELNASATIGEVKTNLPDRTITREGFFAGATTFINDNGRSTVKMHVRIGEIHIDLTD